MKTDVGHHKSLSWMVSDLGRIEWDVSARSGRYALWILHAAALCDLLIQRRIRARDLQGIRPV
jgi:hypothetical protein